MKKIALQVLKKGGQLVGGHGLRKIPGVTQAYQFIYKKVKPSGIQSAEALGHTLYFNSEDTGLAPYLLMGRPFAPEETQVFRDVLKPGMTFVDVGANIGYFSLFAAQLVGVEGRVVAFEPEEENFKLLVKNISENGYRNVTAERMALSDSEGELSFYKDPSNLCAHSLVKGEGRAEVIVPATTFDAYFKDYLPDVVKIDVEGAEPSVLAGMSETLRSNKKPIIIIEYFPSALHRFGVEPEVCLESLKQAGYRISLITPEGIKEISTTKIQSGVDFEKLTNLLCEPKN